MTANIFQVSGKLSDYGWGPTQDGKGIVVWKGDWFEILNANVKLAFTDKTIDTAVHGASRTYVPEAKPQPISDQPASNVVTVDGKLSDYGWGPTQDGKGVVIWKGDWYEIHGANVKLAFKDTTVDTAVHNASRTYVPETKPQPVSDVAKIDGKLADYGWGPTQDGKGIVVWKGDWYEIHDASVKLAFADKTVDTAVHGTSRAYASGWKPGDPRPANWMDAVDDAYQGKPGETIKGNILTNDRNFDAATVKVLVKTQPANGTVTVNPDGTFSYVPKPGFVGEDSFTYTIKDDCGCNDTATVKLVSCAPEEPAPTAAIGDRVWFDADKDGVQDAGEQGVAGATVELKDKDGKVVATQQTDANGNYLFDKLAAGNYSVGVKAPEQYIFTGKDAGGSDAADSDVDTTTGQTGTITLKDGEKNLTVDAGLVEKPAEPPAPTAALGDRIWLDANKNGLQDDGEKGVAGATVELKDKDGKVVATQQTDANGNYLFDKLAAGNYSVGVKAPGEYTFTGKDAGNNGSDAADSDVDTITGQTGTITLKDGEKNLTVDAGLVEKPVEPPAPTAALGDRVWLDANKNGLQDDGEKGVAGATVELKDKDGKVVSTQQTDANGNYLFDKLAAGDYSVGVKAPGEYTFTGKDAGNNGSDAADSDVDTTTGQTGTITLKDGEKNLTVDAGLVQKPVEPPVPTAALGDRVWLDANKNGLQDDGEKGVSGATVELKDKDGKVVATQQTDANGNYLFDKLAAGNYSVGVKAPGEYTFTGKDAGNNGSDAADSDVDTTTGQTGTITLKDGEKNLTVDAGLVAVNKPPVAVDDAGKVACTDKNGISIDVLANDKDPDGDTLTATLKAQAQNGTVTQNPDGTFKYVPKPGFYGQDVFTYSVSDGKGGMSEAKVTVGVDIKTVTTFSSDDFRMAEGQTKNLSIQLNKTAAEDTTITVKLNQIEAKLADPDVKLYSGYILGTKQSTFYFGTEADKAAALKIGTPHHDLMKSRYGLSDAELKKIPVGVQNAIQDFQLLDANGKPIKIAADGTFEVTVKAGENVSEGFSVKALNDMHLSGFHDNKQFQEGNERFSLEVVDVEGAKCLETDKVTGTISNEFLRHTPIALDLNGDGQIGVTGETSSHQKDASAELGKTVAFDIDADGNVDTVEWFKGDGDGILVDTSKIGPDGDIDGSALFGDQGGKFANGYDKLKLFDADGDGHVAGSELDGLGVWIDDGDAKLEAGEMKSAADAGIASISTEMNIVLDDQGRELMQSSAFDIDGQQILTEDVWFAGAGHDAPHDAQHDQLPLEHNQAA